MAIVSRTQLKAWFKRGLYPLESQFHAWIDSFWHRNDQIPISSIENLAATLNGKANTADLDGKADIGHTHSIADVQSLPEKLEELWSKFADYLKGIQHVTYAQLKALRDNAQLKPGQWYRITDYVTTVANDTEARSAGHPFDILVMATSASTLGEDALAVKSARDTEVTVEQFWLLSEEEEWDDDKCFVRYPDADGTFDGDDYLAFRHTYVENGVEQYLYAYTKEDDEAVKVYVPYLTTGTEPDTVKTNWVAITEATGLDELGDDTQDTDMASEL